MEGTSAANECDEVEEEVDEDEKEVSAQVDQFFTEIDLDLAQRRKSLKSLTKVCTLQHLT